MNWFVIFFMCFLCLGICKEIPEILLEPFVYDISSEETAPPAIILTLDVSGTMAYRFRIQKLQSALQQWIEELPNDILLGMVKFSTTEEIIKEITPVNDKTRQDFIQGIPNRSEEETCIGCGVRLALKMLKEKKIQGVMVLITDGDNTEPGQFIEDVEDEVVDYGTQVVAVGFGDIAPLNDLEQLAETTGGKFFAVSDGDGINGLIIALNEALKLARTQVNEITTPEELTSKQESSTTFVTVPVSNSTQNGATTQTPTPQPKDPSSTEFSLGPADEHKIDQPWLIFCIIASVLGAVVIIGVLLLVLWKYVGLTHVSGFYPIVQEEKEKDYNIT